MFWVFYGQDKIEHSQLLLFTCCLLDIPALAMMDQGFVESVPALDMMDQGFVEAIIVLVMMGQGFVEAVPALVMMYQKFIEFVVALTMMNCGFVETIFALTFTDQGFVEAVHMLAMMDQGFVEAVPAFSMIDQRFVKACSRPCHDGGVDDAITCRCLNARGPRKYDLKHFRHKILESMISKHMRHGVLESMILKHITHRILARGPRKNGVMESMIRNTSGIRSWKVRVPEKYDLKHIRQYNSNEYCHDVMVSFDMKQKTMNYRLDINPGSLALARDSRLSEKGSPGRVKSWAILDDSRLGEKWHFGDVETVRFSLERERQI
ncbi:hypothetical protein Lal_00016942 [Lupinus albus]|nr:hypothetical protein Lal_00016942 [Lupinus albus]